VWTEAADDATAGALMDRWVTVLGRTEG